MVALGLTGVVWQSIDAAAAGIRAPPGRRRADPLCPWPGARRNGGDDDLRASSSGRPWSAQLPFLPLPQGVEIVPGEFVGAVALSAAAIYCLTLACGWYPSRLAARMPPADALRYE